MIEHIVTTVLAYLIDIKVGEFGFRKHPVALIGDLIAFLERLLYKPSVFQGGLLVVATLGIVGGIALLFQSYLGFIPEFARIILTSVFASIFVAHRMLYDEVAKIVKIESLEKQRAAISMLVSRDTEAMSQSDVFKAAIETYAENLNDGVVAPLFYLLLFGLPGIVIYKTINTLDSMVGYKNERYERFGKAAAKLDDIANYIPSRLTAMLIMWHAKKSPLFAFFEDGKKHESPNAGLPITAMALALGVKLGGPTSYFGKVKKKAYFGVGEENITKEHLLQALNIGHPLIRLSLFETGFVIIFKVIVLLMFILALLLLLLAH